MESPVWMPTGDDGVARVDADGVKVFHRADGQHVAVAVAQHFELDLFPAVDVFFDEHLRDRRKHETVVRNGAQFFLVERNAAACAAQRERGTDDDGISDLIGDRDALLDGVCDVGRHDGLPDLLHGLFEQFAVLGAVDRVDFGTDEFDAPLVQESFLGKFAADGQPRLPAERSEQAVRAFLDDDALDGFERQRLEVDLIRQRFVRHDGRGVGVAEHDVDARIFQNAACLCARIVEFRRLSDHDRAGTDDKNFFDIASFRHSFFLRPSSP